MAKKNENTLCFLVENSSADSNPNPQTLLSSSFAYKQNFLIQRPPHHLFREWEELRQRDGQEAEVALFYFAVDSHYITRNKRLMNRMYPGEFDQSQ